MKNNSYLKRNSIAINSEKIIKVLEKDYNPPTTLPHQMRAPPKLIEIKKGKQVIFVGDTHGDLEASQKIIKDYLKSGNKIVFLGDYVDRGPYSKENLDFLLETKLKFPEQIYLLQGNHEGHRILKFSPADFWESLTKKEYQFYSSITEKFPLVVVLNFSTGVEKVNKYRNGIIALHGALPDCSRSDLEQIKIGDEKWFQITWGDFVDKPGGYLGINSLTGRPQFGRDWFFEKMEKFDKKVLIRSHQPDCPQFMFDDRCLTIFTSSAYTRERTIAIADLRKEIKTAKDLEIKRI